ncbi:hypothetical protein WR25_08194 [Diploscapter pachys]|uniref:Uncharacterized protein n=1 Tax=Diploscapter pachys TaxID=2018661 RepID=A0A2A2L9L6_9BILA|nr:hypothetical protein WR25_08194 [Diploscapter pachys]
MGPPIDWPFPSSLPTSCLMNGESGPFPPASPPLLPRDGWSQETCIAGSLESFWSEAIANEQRLDAGTQSHNRCCRVGGHLQSEPEWT